MPKGTSVHKAYVKERKKGVSKKTAAIRAMLKTGRSLRTGKKLSRSSKIRKLRHM